MTKPSWQEWRRFPDPSKGEFLTAPYGAGVYWLRDTRNGADIYIGEGSHLAHRVSSLLPSPHGRGTRNNAPLREYVLTNLAHVEYRTTSCSSKSEAVALERRLRGEHRPRF
jgi:excinuclease UvrABC nuclease subunit